MADASSSGPPSPRVVSLEEVGGLIGVPLGVSRWHVITQEDVNHFAALTDDYQPIHVDPVLAADGPFGHTIAHGFLVVSLAPSLLRDIIVFDATTVINCGLNRVRFPAPVPVGRRVRMAGTVADTEDLGAAVEVVFKLTWEVEGNDRRRACTAELILRLVP